MTSGGWLHAGVKLKANVSGRPHAYASACTISRCPSRWRLVLLQGDSTLGLMALANCSCSGSPPGLVEVREGGRRGFWLGLGVGAGGESYDFRPSTGYSDVLYRPTISFRLGGYREPPSGGGEVLSWVNENGPAVETLATLDWVYCYRRAGEVSSQATSDRAIPVVILGSPALHSGRLGPSNTHSPRDPMATRFPGPAGPSFSVLSGALACGGDLLLPDPPGGGENVLSKVDGDNQVGVVGEPLQNAADREGDDRRSSPPSARRWSSYSPTRPAWSPLRRRLPTALARPGPPGVSAPSPVPQTVAAQLVVADTVEPQVAEFTAQAGPGSPDTLISEEPHQPARPQQTRRPGTQPVVQVVDRFGNPVPAVPVAWQVSTGGGEVSEAIPRPTPPALPR